MVFYTLGVQRPLIQAGLLEKKNIIVLYLIGIYFINNYSRGTIILMVGLTCRVYRSLFLMRKKHLKKNMS